MKIEDIKVGTTYVGHSGKPRTVLAFDDGYYSDISYHTGDPEKVSKCWWATFKGWAKHPVDAEERIREDRIKEHAVELLAALEALLDFERPVAIPDPDRRTRWDTAQIVLAKCNGEKVVG